MNREDPSPQSESVQPFVIDTFDRRVFEPTIPSIIPEPRIKPLDDIGQLDAYSQDFAARLLRAHPEWRPQLHKSSSEDGWALWFELPAPSHKIKAAWISTEDAEVTVGFGPTYHAHFSSHPPDPDAQGMERALKFLDDFLAERIVLVTAVRRTSGIESADVSDEQLMAWIKQYRCDRLRIETWNGTFDRDFIAPPAE